MPGYGAVAARASRVSVVLSSRFVTARENALGMLRLRGAERADYIRGGTSAAFFRYAVPASLSKRLQ
jgi:hypothetical protein